MFGKARDTHDTDTLGMSSFEEIFGDEAAAANALEVDQLRDRVEQVETQISSQFTALATYAQIAQEQVQVARAEAKAGTERSEQRLTSLVERERADRVTALTGAPAGSAPDTAARVEALEHSVAQIKKSLDDCRQQQKELALAITTVFERLAPATPTPADTHATTATPAAPAAMPAVTGETPVVDADADATVFSMAPLSLAAPQVRTSSRYDGPITGLALHG